MGDGYTTPCHPGPPAYPHCPVPLPGLWREGNRGSTKRKFLYAKFNSNTYNTREDYPPYPSTHTSHTHLGSLCIIFAGQTSKNSHVSLLLTEIVQTSDTNLSDVCVSIPRQRHLLAQHFITMRHEGLHPVF